MTDTLHLTIYVDERPVRTGTVIDAAGGDSVLTITTTLVEQRLTLLSAYHGARNLPTLVIEQVRRYGRVTRTQHDTPRDELPVTHARDRCLLHHAAQLQQLLNDAGHDARIQVADADLAAAAGAYPPPR